MFARRARVMALALTVSSAAVLSAATASAQILSGESMQRDPLPDGERALDEVAASVEIDGPDRVPMFVLASEVELMLRVEFAMRRAPYALVARPDSVGQQSFLERLIAEKLLQREAGRAGQSIPSPSEIAEERSRLEEAFTSVGGTEAVLRACGGSTDELDALIARRLQVSRFILQRYPRTIDPSDIELRTAFDDDRGGFRSRGSSFAEARAPLREQMRRTNYPNALRAYLRSLRGDARVHLYAAWGTPRE